MKHSQRPFSHDVTNAIVDAPMLELLHHAGIHACIVCICEGKSTHTLIFYHTKRSSISSRSLYNMNVAGSPLGANGALKKMLVVIVFYIFGS